MIGLIKLTKYLLDQQLRALEKAFVDEGGLRERMTRARLAERAKQNKKEVGPVRHESLANNSRRLHAF
jgi:four helix bundle suffix protein